MTSLFLLLSFFPGDLPEPSFIVQTVDGATPSGPLRKLSSDLSLRLGGDRPRLVEGRDFLGLRRRGTVLPAFPRQQVLLFANGDRVPLDPKGPVLLGDDQLICVPAPPLRPEKTVELAVPRTALAALWRTAPEGFDLVDPLDRFMRGLLQDKRNADRLILTNGDNVDGLLKTLDWRKGAVVKTRGGAVEVAWSRVAILALNTIYQIRRPPKQAYGHVVLDNGARLSLASLEFDAGKGILAGKTLFGARVQFPLANLASLEMRQHRTVYLSDLAQKSYEHTPFLGVSWPLVKDAAVTGRDLRLAGDTFAKGLGMHADSQVTYALDGRYQRFEALVGLDDITGQRGRVRLEILVDGKAQPLPNKGVLTGRDPPWAVRVEVGQARVLSLVVRQAGFGDVQAHVNWAGAWLIRRAAGNNLPGGTGVSPVLDRRDAGPTGWRIPAVRLKTQ